jgi:endonuclease/exonuclease/phosphatase family metal-dependent hydrolase
MRLLTYNIHKGIGGRDRRYDLDRIVSVIAQEQPDFICLQEVAEGIPRAGGEAQNALLAASFQEYTSTYQTNHRFRVGSYGNLVLSRWPIRQAHDVCLRYLNRKKRGAQLVVIDSPHGPIHLVNWHLGLHESTRQWQASYLLQHHCFRESAHLPTMIVGDYNDWRNTLAHGPFARHGMRQVTEPLHRFRSFPAYLAMSALDKAFCCEQVDVTHAEVVRSPLARQASDHLPLVLDFRVRHRTNGAIGPDRSHSEPLRADSNRS